MAAADLGEDAADTNHHNRPDIAVAAESDDHFADTLLHALHQHTVKSGFRQCFADPRQHAIHRGFQRSGIVDAEHDAAVLGFVRNVGGKDFHRDRETGVHSLTAVLHHLRGRKRNAQHRQD